MNVCFAMEESTGVDPRMASMDPHGVCVNGDRTMHSLQDAGHRMIQAAKTRKKQHASCSLTIWWTDGLGVSPACSVMKFIEAVSNRVNFQELYGASRILSMYCLTICALSEVTSHSCWCYRQLRTDSM